MLIVNPRDQKKLVQDIKSVSRPNEEIAKSSQDNLSKNQESQPKKQTTDRILSYHRPK